MASRHLWSLRKADGWQRCLRLGCRTERRHGVLYGDKGCSGNMLSPKQCAGCPHAQHADACLGDGCSCPIGLQTAQIGEMLARSLYESRQARGETSCPLLSSEDRNRACFVLDWQAGQELLHRGYRKESECKQWPAWLALRELILRQTARTWRERTERLSPWQPIPSRKAQTEAVT